jgi:hypothetical protein
LKVECVTFYFRGRPYLVRLKQARKNLKKYIRGKLPDHEVIGSGTIVENKEVMWLIKRELEQTEQRRRGYPERGRPLQAKRNS